MDELLENEAFTNVPNIADTIEGTVVSASRREVRIDIDGLTVGIVRGRELFSESDQYNNLEPGQRVEATVIDLENENGEMELSFKYAGEAKAWETMREMFTSGETHSAKVLDANKGGLIVKVGFINGFLPVSQLAPEHYPRVSGGAKTRILEKLKEYVGTTFRTKVIDVNEDDNKLIVSEKAVWEEEQKNVIAEYNKGDNVEGIVTAVADFGAFVKFPLEAKDEASYLEGLVHISEIAWQRIDHPRDFVKVGDQVKAEIIGIEGSKIFLSMKKLITNPWEIVAKKYNVGDVVEGKVLKANPFGFFVELDKDIHGLAHISELSDKPVTDLNEIAKPGEMKKFVIVSIEPEKHRLGLSLKALGKKATKSDDNAEGEKEAATETASEEAPTEEKAEPSEAPAEASTESAAPEAANTDEATSEEKEA